MKHTPGPWTATAQTVTAPETEDRLPLDVRLYGGNRQDHAANARLIAAAPLMYGYIEAKAKLGDLAATYILKSIHGGAV